MIMLLLFLPLLSFLADKSLTGSSVSICCSKCLRDGMMDASGDAGEVDGADGDDIGKEAGSS